MGAVVLSPETVKAAATAAKIPANKRRAFASILTASVRGAHTASHAPTRAHANLSNVTPHLAKLRQALESLQPEQPGEAAGAFFAAALAPGSIDELLECLDRAEQSVRRSLPKKGAPKGFRTPDFNMFTVALVTAANGLGGKLTCNRQPGGGYTGTFFDLLASIACDLPDGFVPPERTIERVFRAAKHTAK